MEFKQHTLSNGLTIIAEVNPQAVTMATGFFVRTGSRDETPDVAGVSHFLEHMVFKGTPRRTALEVNLEFDRMGAQFNAFTSEESTVYFASVIPEFQHDALDLLGDILRPSLRQEDFDMEKGVILEEIAMYEDQPHFRLYDNLMTQHFAPHPLANTILGSSQSITDLKRDEMQAYFDRRYSPTNVTLVGVGNLDFDAMVAQAEELCGHWTPFDAPRLAEECNGHSRRDILVDTNLTRQNIGLMCPAPSYQSDDHYAAELLASLLGDATGSRLYYALIETALADEASMSYSAMDHAGALLTFISCDPENTAKVLEIAQKQFAEFLAEGPTEAELQAAKNKIATSATLKGEQPMGRLVPVGMDWVYRGDYTPLKTQIDSLFAVGAEQIMQLANAANFSQPTLLTLGPLEKLPE